MHDITTPLLFIGKVLQLQTVTIVGGAGGMGQLFKRFWKNFKINILDEDDWILAEEYLRNSDLVIISVPIAVTAKVIKKVCLYLDKNTILADLTSIKLEPVNKMLELHSGSVIGLHPMFGPTATTSNEQILINCGGRDLGNCSWFWENLKLLNFSIINLTPEEHDKYMSFIQGIEHFITFSMGNFLKSKDVHPEKIFDIASPIYQMKLLLMGRIFDQDPNLYADIVMSDETRIKLICEYIDYLTSLKTMLISKDKNLFVQNFKKVSNWMNNFTKYAQNTTDKIFSKILSKK